MQKGCRPSTWEVYRRYTTIMSGNYKDQSAFSSNKLEKEYCPVAVITSIMLSIIQFSDLELISHTHTLQSSKYFFHAKFTAWDNRGLHFICLYSEIDQIVLAKKLTDQSLLIFIGQRASRKETKDSTTDHTALIKLMSQWSLPLVSRTLHVVCHWSLLPPNDAQHDKEVLKQLFPQNYSL